MKLITTALPAIALLALTSCLRFGNGETDQPVTDTVTGYYETSPQTLSFCASIYGVKETCVDVSAYTSVPTEISGIFSNPVGMFLDNPDTGATYFFNPTSKFSLGPVEVDPDKSITLSSGLDYATLWNDKACTMKRDISIDGAYTNSGPFTSGSTLRLSGRVSLAITVTTVFDGNCTASLQAIAACYQSGGSSCLGSVNPALGTQSDVIGMFGPFFQNGL
ncbi:MAG: hypothetical protein ACXWP5_08475, partial [Bdellovibrionota bacterium]